MMKKYYTLLAACFLFAQADAQNAISVKPKLSLMTKHYLHELQKNAQQDAPPAGFGYRQNNGTVYVKGMVKVANTNVAAAMEDMGVIIGTKAGDIWTVQVPYQKVAAFTELTGMSYIQLDEPAKPAMDAARKSTRADSVHGGYNLPYAFSGKGVIVGVIDFGFDYAHPTFFDTLGTGYRVKKVWELNGTGTPPSGYSYGRELTGDATIQAAGTDNTVQTHGTAVAGMASGSGFGGDPTNAKYRGMAYDAEMVLVGVRRDSISTQWREGTFSDFADGINYIFTQAAAVSKPAVVNISWGSQSGPHDGTSLFNQACNNLTGTGKIVVMSAGNEGQENIHLAKTFTASDTVVNTFLTFTDPTYKRTWVDIWGEPGKTFCATAQLFNGATAGNTMDYICLDNMVHDTFLIASNGLDTCFIEYVSATADHNGRPHMILNIFNKSATEDLRVSLKGTSGQIHAWDEYYYYGYTHSYSSNFESLGRAGAVGGNNVSTASDMGAASSVLLIGAYASKNEYYDIFGTKQSYSGYVNKGGLAPFSSRGPLVDGTTKPDITAPGITIGTATSSFDTRYSDTGKNKLSVVSSYTHPGSGKKYFYAEFLGTSASAPAAAGIIALMLQANPRLTPAQTKTIIINTALKDNFTGTIPTNGSNLWGFGKINAYAAVRQALQENSVYQFSGQKLDCTLFPSPNHGSFMLDYTGTKAEELTINVVNVAGAQVANTSWKVNAGSNQKQLNLSHLAKGLYIVNVASQSGQVAIKTEIQ